MFNETRKKLNKFKIANESGLNLEADVLESTFSVDGQIMEWLGFRRGKRVRMLV